jgi:hypothetical protein
MGLVNLCTSLEGRPLQLMESGKVGILSENIINGVLKKLLYDSFLLLFFFFCIYYVVGERERERGGSFILKWP